MPVSEREGSRGQVLRGVCSKCSTVTKGRTLGGAWISKCAHPGTLYHGRMMAGGKKTIPVIPDSVDRGHLPGGVGAAIEAGAAAEAEIEPPPELPPASEWAKDQIRGMIGKNDLRDDEKPAAAPLPSAGDPLTFDVRASLESIAAHARGLAGALAGAQRRIRELEGLVATQAIEGAHLRDRLEDSESEVARLHGFVDELQQKLDEGQVRENLGDDDCEDVADRDVKPENDEPDEPEEFDPDEIPF